MTMDERIALGVLVLDKVGIADKNKTIQSSFRGQISSFGAAVTTGSLTAAVAFFSKQKQAKTDRGLLMVAIFIMMNKSNIDIDKITEKNVNSMYESASLLDYVMKAPNKDKVKKEIIDNAVALKLAMNAYKLDDGDKKKNEEHKTSDGKDSKDGETG